MQQQHYNITNKQNNKNKRDQTNRIIKVEHLHSLFPASLPTVITVWSLQRPLHSFSREEKTQ
eukprot:m.17535 g.17535  ORF g.17535 m.17535 type:complete len:62 (+) comp8156_c0_seq2:204-389(+)